MKKLFYILLSCLYLTHGFAQNISNKVLLKACKDNSQGPTNFCYGFIIASANAAQFYRNMVDVQDEYVNICFPKDISNKELVELYIAWADKNSTVADSPAFIGVSTSFSIKYSCPSKDDSEKNKDLKNSKGK